MITIDFRHQRFVFREEELIKYGSPHFSKREAGEALLHAFRARSQPMCEHSLTAAEDLVICANEVFPEAALADPLADLEVWDEWKSGFRQFPYPGKYSRLGIRSQPGKTQSPASVGVLGEVTAGLFAQAGIAPWVLVRCIRKWPDLILHTGDGCYGFVEAKAYTAIDSNRLRLGEWVPEALLAEALADAVQQLNADAFVTVWGSFTAILSITPLCLMVTFAEFAVSDAKRHRQHARVVPEPVVRGLAERAINRALSDLSEEEIAALAKEKRARRRKPPGPREKALADLAGTELEAILAESELELAVADVHGPVKVCVDTLVRQGTFPDPMEGERLARAKQSAVRGEFTLLRGSGDFGIYMADMTREQRGSLSTEWKRDFAQATASWADPATELPIWRCGGALFARGGSKLAGARPPARGAGR